MILIQSIDQTFIYRALILKHQVLGWLKQCTWSMWVNVGDYSSVNLDNFSVSQMYELVKIVFPPLYLISIWDGLRPLDGMWKLKDWKMMVAIFYHINMMMMMIIRLISDIHLNLKSIAFVLFYCFLCLFINLWWLNGCFYLFIFSVFNAKRLN